MADLTLKVLEQIRDEIKLTRTDLSTRIDQTNQRLDQTNERLERVERRQVEGELRVSTELVGLSSAIGDLNKVLVEDRKLRSVVLNHEQRIKALERKKAS
jgi:hypothetical protein